MATGTRYFKSPDTSLNKVQRHYLKPLNTAERIARRSLYSFSYMLVKSSLSLRVEGLEHLPDSRPFVLTPSHTSSLDPFLLAAALPYSTIKHCHWAASAHAVMLNRFRQASNRLAGSVPIWRGRSALAVGAEVIRREQNLIWFPEGHRTRDGQLQDFRPGIGWLAVHTLAPVVPIRILGAFEAMPPGTKVPKFRSRVQVRIGKPLQGEQADEAEFEAASARFTEQLHAAMTELGA